MSDEFTGEGAVVFQDFAGLIEAAHDAIIAASLDGVVVRWIAGAECHCGYAAR